MELSADTALARPRHPCGPLMESQQTTTSLRAVIAPMARVGILAVGAGVVVVVQDVVIASKFAAGAAVDAYQLAVSFPTMAINVLAGGTLLATMVPRLVQLDTAGQHLEGMALVKQARRAMWWLLLATCAVWAVAFPYVARTVATGFAESTLATATRLTWLHLLSLLLTGMAWVDVAVQSSRGRFWLLSLTPAFGPAGATLGVLLASDWLGIGAASVGTVAASAALWAVARTTTARLIGRVAPGAPPAPVGPAILGGAYATAAGGAMFLGGILLSDTWMASTLPAGSSATFAYATRPVILSLAFVTTTAGNVLLPAFSRLVANGEYGRLRRQFLLSAAVLVVATTPAVVLVFVEAATVVALMYERGTFTPADTANVAAVQRIYVLQLPWFLVAMLGWRVMNSLQRNASLLVSTVVAFAVNIGVDVWLAPSYGLAGIAWGTNLAFVALAVLVLLPLVVARPRG